ncbi:MAG: hypothetical protein GEU96_02245 [Propionibacteriales bacterium]|nr:hypothetical protein [Propionibacteriales bacterium]
MTTDTTTPVGGALVGNRLALAGAVLYLSEWVAIFVASPPEPFGPGTDTSGMVAAYAEHTGAAAVSAGWFAVVLVGRVIFIAGLKASLRARPREQPLLDLALGAMAISVAIEIIVYAIIAAAAGLGADGASTETLSMLDGSAYWLGLMIFGPVGVAVLAGASAMLRSRLFARWICWVGLAAGAAAILGSVLVGAIGESWGPALVDTTTTVGALGMWTWMIATGVVLWRRSRVARINDASAAPPQPAPGRAAG